jgi:diacylglycerol kinase family enzyme
MMQPQDGSIFFIVNPKSGASSDKRLVGDFRTYLEHRGYDIRIEYTESLEHGCQLAQEAGADDRYKLVAAAGGDGTIREVVHGLSGSKKPLLIIPCGTENLLAN